MSVRIYNKIKRREAQRRRAVINARGSRAAMAHQRQVSLVGDAAKWRITNLPQVLTAMAKWA